MRVQENSKGKNKKKNNLKLEGMSIKFILILSIVPVVAVLLIALTVVTSVVSRNIIIERSNSEMSATLGKYTNYIDGEMYEIKAQADTLSKMIGATYTSTSIGEYDEAITSIVTGNDMVLGSGIWFEPNVYDPEQKYYGPYWMKNTDSEGKWDGGALNLTWEYSDENYDYFNQEYYKNAKSMDGASITNPYFDDASGMVMASCSAPIKSGDGTFIGCVTVTLMLGEVNQEIGKYKSRRNRNIMAH